MSIETKMDQWTASYKRLAEKIIADQVAVMAEQFPDETYPVRPPYRRAMYEHLMIIVDELNGQMEELLAEAPDEADEVLKEKLMHLQESYEQEFVRQVRKEEDHGHGA